MSTPPTPDTGPVPPRGAGAPELPEHFLSRESERIVRLLKVRRRATTVIAVVFVLATASAILLLTWYVQGEQKRVDALGSRLESADRRLREQDEWLGRLEQNRALVDSILTQYQALIAAMRDSTMQYSDSLAAARDAALRAEVGEAERRAEQQSAVADSAWSRDARATSDSLGLRMTRAEGLAGSIVSRLDTIAPWIARHERRMSELDASADSVRGALARLSRELEALENGARQDSAAIQDIQRRIVGIEGGIEDALTPIRKRLEHLEAQAVPPPRSRQP